MTGYVDVPGGRLEMLDLPGDEGLHPLVLLHEGLGSIGLWRGFPEALNHASGARTVVSASVSARPCPSWHGRR